MVRSAVTLTLVAGLAGAAWAEVISTSGSTSAFVQELRSGTAGLSDQAAKAYPADTATLPLQVVVRLLATDEDAGASAAAQFADPATATGDNPEEFAITVAVDSLGQTASYTTQTRSEELRSVRFTSAELSGFADGDTVQIRGQLFLDCVLTIFAVKQATDLTGAAVTFRATVVKELADGSPQSVFSGALLVTGGPAQAVTVTANGSLPKELVTTSDLSYLDSQLGVFRAVTLPSTPLEYVYDATIGEQFSLRATIAIEATNIPGGVGVAALVGTPISSLVEVIGKTRSEATARVISTALLQERTQPTGAPAFAADEPASSEESPARGGSGLCGLFGFESIFAVLGLAALRCRNNITKQSTR